MRDAGTLWAPEAGQAAFDFTVRDLAARVETFAARSAQQRKVPQIASDDGYGPQGAVRHRSACRRPGAAR